VRKCFFQDCISCGILGAFDRSSRHPAYYFMIFEKVAFSARWARLIPAFSKQLLPINGKSMIKSPLLTLMLGRLGDILMLTTPRDRKASARRSMSSHAFL
jgi:hypothetical protein